MNTSHVVGNASKRCKHPLSDSKARKLHPQKTDGSKAWKLHLLKTDGSKAWKLHLLKTDGSKAWKLHLLKTDGSKAWKLHLLKMDGSKAWKLHLLFLMLMVAIGVMAIVNLLIGSVKIPVADILRILVGDDSHEIWTNIIWKSRLPQVLTAIVAGAGLSVSGLQMQTVFRNPLAGPSVLGISNGSALGVAFVVLLSGKIGGVALSRLGYYGDAAMSVAAIIGAMAVMLLILWVAQRVKGNVTLLIIGVMIGYLANAIIGVLKFLAPDEDVKSFVVWGLGSFSRVSGNEMILFVVLMCILLPLSFLLVKPMNLMLLGDRYAANLGLNIRRARMMVIISSGILVAIVTAYCGPIMFIGLAVPHLARAIFRSSDHRILMPATALCGAFLALVCNFIARMPGFEGALPVNSVTALVGAPVIAAVIFGRRKNEAVE